MNESDLQMFLDSARETSYYALFYTALFTGLRRSELLALMWSDVDLLLCQLSVNRTLHHLHSGKTFYGQPKNGKSRRMVSLSPSTATVLREHRAQQEVLRATLGLPLSDSDLVFSTFDGKPLVPESVSQAWRIIARKAGLRGLRFHDARHTHASLMLKQGIHPKIVQERLGHSSIQITLDTYSHVAQGLQEAAARSFDAVISPAQLEQPVKVVG